MKKVITLSFLLLFSMVYIVSSSPILVKQLARSRYLSNNIFFRADKYRYGDLFGITYLSKFKISSPNYNPIVVHSKNRNIHLYTLGDSYIAGLIHANNFNGVDTIFLANWKDSALSFNLDRRKINILLIETTERTFLHKFGSSKLLKYPFLPNAKIQKNAVFIPFEQYIFNKHINDNIESTLFDNPFFTQCKQARADLNYALFKRLPSTVVISNDEKYLFLRSTVDTSFMMPTESSSFKSIPDSLLKTCINNCNTIATFYKNAGFSEVYFSIIPNPVSVIGFSPYTYNGLLPKIEAITFKNFQTIDMYPDFLLNKEKVYLKSETHWSPIGLQMWIDKVNGTLNKDGYISEMAH